MIYSIRLWLLLSVVFIILGLAIYGPEYSNSYQRDGTIQLSNHKPAAEVEIVRDVHGVPYVFAKTLQDALWGQGFALAQDRPFQLEVMRRIANGTLAEMVGKGGLNTDILVRTLRLREMAIKRTAILASEERELLIAYVAGINAFVTLREGDTAAEFSILNFNRHSNAPVVKSGLWQVEDVVALFLYHSYYFARSNTYLELKMQALLESVPADTAQKLTPFTPNPDDPIAIQSMAGAKIPLELRRVFEPVGIHNINGGIFAPPADVGTLVGDGSNSWAVAASRSSTGKAILVNDPHLDVRQLPGPWHPIGLITPKRSIVGANIGLPGIFTGRSGPVAFGVTIGYADTIDLYIERLNPSDPGKYKVTDSDQTTWAKFVIQSHQIKVHDLNAADGMRIVEMTTRHTHSGRSVILGSERLDTPNRAISLRWAPLESSVMKDPKLGIFDLLLMDSVEDGVNAASEIDIPSLNLVFADADGRIARRATGAVPVRTFEGIALKPAEMAKTDWNGIRIANGIPGEINPERGWTGSANHMVAHGRDASLYATITSTTDRYRRMQEIFNGHKLIEPNLAWKATFDVKNLLAERVTPIFVQALETSSEFADFAKILSQWDYKDTIKTAAPLIFQAMIMEVADLAYGRVVDDALRNRMLQRWEFWQERIGQALANPAASPLFDSAAVRDQLIREAAQITRRKLSSQYGAASNAWSWGEAHKLRFVGPLCVKEKSCWFGSHDLPLAGSGQTLARGAIFFRRDGKHRFDPWSVVSLRIMVDFSKPDRIRFSHPGGVVGRTFHPNLDDGLSSAFSPEAERYLWTTREAIETSAKHKLLIRPY